MNQFLANARRAELDQLVKSQGGTLTPAAVVEFARDPGTALHSLFTWDDTEAAAKYRELEAARYIRAVVKVIPRAGDASPLRVRAFVSMADERGTGVYRPTIDVVSTQEGRAALLAQALKELQAMRERYSELQELTEVFSAIDAAAHPVAA